MTNPPSFGPWLTRIRMARMWGSLIALVAVTLSAWNGGGLPIVDAALRGLVAAGVAWFVVWAGALWVCSELYQAQIGSMQQQLQQLEAQRREQLQKLYEGRSDPLSSVGFDPSATAPMTPPPRRREAA